MELFKKIENRFANIPVTLIDHSNTAGVLKLDGSDTEVQLTGDFPFARPEPPGWFDLKLKAANGRELLLHNAIRTSDAHHFSKAGSESRLTKIFPNVIVTDSENIDILQISRVQFSLAGWLSFFAYSFVEYVPCSNAPNDFFDTLRRQRHENKIDEPFDPVETYIAHSLPVLLEFSVQGSTYKIWSGRRSKGGFQHSINIRTEIFGSIEFEESTTIEAAMNACWDWRRYFHQLAMSEIPFSGMAVSSDVEPRSNSGSLYLPHVRNSDFSFDKPPEAYHMPLNRWEERDAAQDAMEQWLGKQAERRTFRAALDRVLIRRQERVAVEDILQLCAGIETLPELSLKTDLPMGALGAMTEATVSAAKAHGVDFDYERVRGVLGTLQIDNLRGRLMRMIKCVAPETTTDTAKQLTDLIMPFRLYVAHGRTYDASMDRMAGPVIDALSALCARFDLQSAGVPMRTASNARSLPLEQWDEALFEIKARQ